MHTLLHGSLQHAPERLQLCSWNTPNNNTALLTSSCKCCMPSSSHTAVSDSAYSCQSTDRCWDRCCCGSSLSTQEEAPAAAAAAAVSYQPAALQTFLEELAAFDATMNQVVVAEGILAGEQLGAGGAISPHVWLSSGAIVLPWVCMARKSCTGDCKLDGA
jgi:hypothetical protein